MFAISIFIRFVAIMLALLPVTAASSAEPDPPAPQRRAEKGPELTIDQARLQLRPRLRVEAPCVDCESWETETTLTGPEIRQFHWGLPITGDTAIWKLTTGRGDTIVQQGAIPGFSGVSTPDYRWRSFNLDFGTVLPATPPNSRETYRLTVQTFKDGVPGEPSNSVIVYYQEPPDATVFTEEGLNSQLYNDTLLQSKRFFVSFDVLNIVKADEPGEEEPYIIPIVILFDGTSILVNDLPNAEVRVFNKGPTHHNIPRYNNALTTGTTVAVPNGVGYYEFDLRPIGAREWKEPVPGVEHPLVLNDLGIGLSSLTRGTFIWVAVLALEEDDTQTDTANAMRDALIGAVRSELTNCLRLLTISDLLKLTREDSPEEAISNLHICIDENKYESLDLETPYEEAMFKDYIVAYLQQIGTDAAMGEEMDEARNWLPGGGLFLINSIANRDDVVGFDDAFFSMDEILKNGRPMRFDLRTGKVTLMDQFNALQTPQGQEPPPPENVTYEIQGKVGRCNENKPVTSRCAPYIHPATLDGGRPYD